MQSRGIILLWVAMLLLSCSPKALREAKDVVAQADSLRAAGQMYMDSTCLAQSYNTLHAWRYVCADEYTHACYHYGRLLREKDNPVEAMECFIAASHAHTRDYHILGRVYSNMGDIAHLAGEFPLAYDMYERSGQMYLKNRDSLLYYYDLNNMAFELAEQGKKEEAYVILDSICKNCNDRDIYIKTIETRAVACKLVQQYDSTIYYTSVSFIYGCYAPNILLNRAQGYSLMGQKDSAVYYANELILHTDELFFINSALYILTHEDDQKDIEDVRNISAERSDTQKLIEIRQGKLSQAVQLLEQDRTSKPDYRWLYGILVTLAITVIGIYAYIYRKRSQHALLSQRVEDLTIQNKEAEERQARQYHERLRQIQENCDVLACSDNMMDSIQWKNYENFCEFINAHFFLLADKLKATGCLNEKEIRLCVLVLIGSLSDKQMANILYYSYKSIRSTKRTLAIKLGTTSANLRPFLMEKAAK